jgi:hypothetical protein
MKLKINNNYLGKINSLLIYIFFNFFILILLNIYFLNYFELKVNFYKKVIYIKTFKTLFRKYIRI